MTENIIKKMEEKLSSLVGSAPAGTGIYAGRTILRVNETFCLMTGYAGEEITGRDISILYPSVKEFELAVKEQEISRSNTGTGAIETRWKKKDGSTIDIILRTSAISSDDLSGVIFTALDITDRNFSTYIEKSPDAVFIADSGGIILQMNSRASEITGYAPEELVGLHVNRIHTEDEIPLLNEKLNEIRSSGKAKSEFTLKKKDGGLVPVLFESSLLTGGRVIGHFRDISEIKKYGKKLREYSDRVKTIADNIPGIIYQYNISSNSRGFTYISERAYGMFGIDFKSPGYHTEYTSRIHPDHRERFIQSTAEAVRQKSKWFCEWPFLHSSGETRWYRGISNPEITENELIYYGIVQDITDEKDMANSLAVSEARYRNLVELAVNGILLSSHDAMIIEVNTQLEKMTGKSRDELIGLKLDMLFPEEELKKKPLKLDLLISGEIIITERVLKRDDGVHVIVETHSKMMPDGTFQAIFHDITERKRKDEAIAAEKERLAVTLRSIGDGVIATDREGNILLMNDVAETITGWRFNECRGKQADSIVRILHETTRKPAGDIIGSVIQTGAIQDISENIILLSRDGEEIIISLSAAPIRGAGKEISGVVIVFHDMTENRKMAEGLHRSMKLDSLATLAGGIAHDFNNMLAGILGYIDLARNYSRNGEDLKKYLDKAITVFDRAKSLTTQLLTFAHGGDPVIRAGSIKSVLRGYAVSALTGSDIKCSFDIPANLWQCNFDSAQVGQVIYNIVTNAREFMKSGGSIDIRAENVETGEGNSAMLKPGNYVKVEIRDTGEGIPGDILPHIFDPFFTTKKSGHGLGLSTSYSIILRHGGILDADSIHGRGSRFWFYLPAAEADGKKSAKIKAAEHRGSGTVILMDDESFILEITSKILNEMGYSTVQARDGREMLEKYGEYSGSPGLKCIILDLTIPDGMGGKEAVTELRKINREIPVFASSGYSNDHIMSNPSEYGFTDSIRKPFTAEELSELLNRHLTG